MKKIFALLLVVIISLSFTSCDAAFSSVDELMRPPKLSGDDKKLQEAFEVSVSEYDDIILKTPIIGKYKSSYILFNIDGKGSDEAIVLYSVPVEGNSVIAEIFKHTDGEWISVSKISTESSDVYEIDFADINGDGCNEILLGRSNNTYNDEWFDVDLTLNLSHTVLIYSYNGEKTEVIASELYSNLFINDLNNDNAEEMILFKNNFSSIENLTSARVLSYNKDYSVKYDETISITGMLEIENIVSDTTTLNGRKISRIFVDGAINDTEIITEIIEIDKSDFNIALPLYDDNLSFNPDTLRNNKIHCMDVDNDGTIEVPSVEIMPFSEMKSKDKSIPLQLIVWSEYVDNSFNVKFKTILNSKTGHVAIIPERFIGTVSVIYDEENRNLTFYSVDSNGKIINALFSYRVFTIPQWDEDNFNYEKIHENDTYVYAFLIFKSDNYNYYKKYITENFYAL